MEKRHNFLPSFEIIDESIESIVEHIENSLILYIFFILGHLFLFYKQKSKTN